MFGIARGMPLADCSPRDSADADADAAADAACGPGAASEVGRMLKSRALASAFAPGYGRGYAAARRCSGESHSSIPCDSVGDEFVPSTLCAKSSEALALAWAAFEAVTAEEEEEEEEDAEEAEEADREFKAEAEAGER